MTTTTVRRRSSAFAAGLATLAMALSFTALPAGAAPPPRANYIALGDSYAAGQGAFPYTDPSCFVSRKGYPEIADKNRGLVLTANASCSGYSTADVLQHLPSLSGVQVVTVTVGGNDLDTTGLLATCFTVAADCQGAFLARAAILAQAEASPGQSVIVQRLAAISQTIRNQAPNATIVFTGYPMLFDPAFPDSRVGPINQLTASLNRVIAAVAGGTGAQFVDVAPAFASHGIGSSDPWINYDAANIFDPANFHPNGLGYRHGYYASMVGALTSP